MLRVVISFLLRKVEHLIQLEETQVAVETEEEILEADRRRLIAENERTIRDTLERVLSSNYFDDAEVEAARALRRAFELAQRNKNEATKGAIQRFWDGMVAANKASGSLGPTTRPAGSGKGSSAPPRQAPTSQPQKQGGSAAGKAGPSGSNQDAAPTGG